MLSRPCRVQHRLDLLYVDGFVGDRGGLETVRHRIARDIVKWQFVLPFLPVENDATALIASIVDLDQFGDAIAVDVGFEVALEKVDDFGRRVARMLMRMKVAGNFR